MKIFIKKLVVKIFNLSDISDMLSKAKHSQKDLDEKHWKEILHDEMEKLQREHSLELQERDSIILMLEEKITSYKNREKEVENKEFLSKKQIKENYFIAQNIASKITDFQEIVTKLYGEMLGVVSTTEGYKRKIESKGA